MFNQTLTPIIGIDLGLNKSVLEIFTPDDGQMIFRTIPTNAEELTDLFEEFPQATFVIEACALTGWVYDLATARPSRRTGRSSSKLGRRESDSSLSPERVRTNGRSGF